MLVSLMMLTDVLLTLYTSPTSRSLHGNLHADLRIPYDKPGLPQEYGKSEVLITTYNFPGS